MYTYADNYNSDIRYVSNNKYNSEVLQDNRTTFSFINGSVHRTFFKIR